MGLNLNPKSLANKQALSHNAEAVTLIDSYGQSNSNIAKNP